MAVPRETLLKILKHFVDTKNLQIKGRKRLAGDENRAYFVWRRAMKLGDDNAAWLADPNLAVLKGRIASEYKEVEDFLVSQVGTPKSPGPLLPVLGGVGDTSPRHLDLADLAHQRMSEDPTSRTVKNRAKSFSNLRYLRVQAIIWRAAALNEDVWEPSADKKTAVLKKDTLVTVPAVGPLNELLDRRLRTVERMHFNIADKSGNFGGMGYPKWNATGATGPWKDDFRVRIFEYPRFPASFKTQVGESAIGAHSVLLMAPSSHDPASGTPHPPHTGSPFHWTWSEDHRRMEWNVIPATSGYDPVNLKSASSTPSGDAAFETVSAHHLVPGAKIVVSEVDPAIYNGFYEVKNVTSATEFTVRLGANPVPAAVFGFIYKPVVGWRLAPGLRPDWRAAPDNQYKIDLAPSGGRTGAQAVDAMFKYEDNSRVDVWNRSWLWCDHTIAACHIEALVFGLRRRFNDGDARFNKLVTGVGPPDLPDGAKPPYVRLTPVVPVSEPASTGKLMSHNKDRHFENTLVHEDDLQIGDHIVFWNHILYDLISTGDWRLENALVMNVESLPEGGTRRSRILLQGHGTPIRAYADYQALIAKKLEPAMTLAREKIRTSVNATPSITSIPWRETRLVKWSPYGNFQKVKYPGHGNENLGAWWVEIPIDHPSVLWNTVAETVAGLPKSVGDKAGPLAVHGTGFNPPPKPTKAVYFPLFEPRMSFRTAGKKLEGWDAFLTRRQTQNVDPVTLDFVNISGSLVPGIFLRTDRKVAAVRAKATLP